MGEPEVGIGVGLHRSADVDDQHEPARPDAAATVLEAHRLAATTQHRAHRAPRVEGATARPFVAAAQPRLTDRVDRGDQPAYDVALAGR